MIVVRLPSSDPRLGGKAASLSRLLELGFRVPPAVALPAEAAPPDAAGMPPGVAAELEAAARSLGERLAVRSSALGEDSATRSFAGMFDTILDVPPEGVPAAVARCWASLVSTRARSYQDATGADARAMAVVVQRLVAADVAGVAFTCDPVARSMDRVVVEAVPGLGEGLVSGRKAPERWVFSRPALDLIAGPMQASGRSTLGEQEAREIAELALSVERELGGPQDVEWAREDGTTWLLQARPVTTSLTTRTEVWTNSNTAELLPGPAAPMTVEVLDAAVRVLLAPVLTLAGIELGTLPIFGLVGGRIYFSVNTLAGLIRAIPGMRSKNPADLFGGDRAATERALARLQPADLPAVHVSRLRLLFGLLRMLRLLWRHRAVDSAALEHMRGARAHLDRHDPAAASDEGLVPEVRRLLAGVFGGEDGLTATIAGMVATGMLQALCKRALGDRDGAIAGRLLQAVGGLDSAEAGDALWRLVEPARAVAEALRDGRWQELRPVLQGSAEGRAFVAAFDRFLADHGHHARGEVDIAIPRWREDPDSVLVTLRAFLGAPGPDPLATRAQRAAERAALEQDCRRRLGWPLARLFDALLVRARRGFALRENIKSEGVRVLYAVRRQILEGGARLAARGQLATADEVMFLTLGELAGALTGRQREVAPRIERRSHALARDRARHPPPVVVGEWDGVDASAPPPVTSGRLLGIPASPGVAEGRARVILAEDTRERVLPGEVLVAPFTDPGWTPYFVAAAAVVVDVGGVFSHGSIVAREYGLPAVVNVGQATQTIRTGQRIRVDGARGEVLILEE